MDPQPLTLPPLPDEVMHDPRAGLLDPRAWFSEPARPLEIEIGSGKGTFLVQEAPASPSNYLGIEWAREFAAYAADRVARRGLANVRILHADAGEVLHWRLPDTIARVIHVYFPDPWPKARHHRRRLIQDRFLADARRVLVPDGEIRIVTDHEGYWAWMIEHVAPWCGPWPGTQADVPGGFERVAFAPPSWAGAGELVGTNFERKYRREGRPFHAMTLRRVPPGLAAGPVQSAGPD